MLKRARVWLRRAYGDVEKDSLVVKEGIYGELVHSKGQKTRTTPSFEGLLRAQIYQRLYFISYQSIKREREREKYAVQVSRHIFFN